MTVLFMWHYFKAFFVGGAICLVGQLFINLTKLTPARILVGYVVTGVILGAVGVYEPLADFAGAGATVPLTGFGASLAEGARQGIAEYGAFGVITGPLSYCSSGITVAVMAGLAAAVLFKSSEK